MYKQKTDHEILVSRVIRIRRHDAVIFETCRPIFEICKKSTIYRGMLKWNNLLVHIRNIETLVNFKSFKKQELFFY